MQLPDLYRPHLHVVSAVHDETETCRSLRITPLNGKLPTCHAGQFNMVTVFGYGEIPVSLAKLDEDQSIWHTVQSVGPVSRAFCHLKLGEIVGLRGPFGTPWPMAPESDGSLIVIAGGLGVAALRMVIEDVVFERRRFKNFLACIGGRRPETLPYWSDLMLWSKALTGCSSRKICMIFNESGEEWGLPRGVVTDLLPASLGSPRDTKAFICGPEPMMKAAALALQHLGVAPEQIFLSIERNMKCGFGGCGHCQLQSHFVCRNGPIFAWPRVADLLAIREL